jgi:hypothetical protein
MTAVVFTDAAVAAMGGFASEADLDTARVSVAVWHRLSQVGG